MFQPGDVLLFKRTTLISKAIRLIQGNAFIHAALVLSAGDENTAQVAEIDSDFPARLVRFSVAAKNGSVTVYRNNKLKFDGNMMWWHAIQLLRTEYNYVAIFQAVINHLLGRLCGFLNVSYNYRNYFQDNGKLTCSTLTSLLLSYGNPQYQFDPTAEPDDFCKGDWKVVKTGL